MSTSEAQKEAPMFPEPQKEHRWLQRLVGDWTYEAEASMVPDNPPEMWTGTETVRSLGGLWTIAEALGEMPGGAPMTSIMTIGYDPQKKRFVGTFIASVTTTFWVYDGELDQAEKILTLNAEGPDFQQPDKTVKYKDVIELKNDDHRVLTSHLLGEDGQWHQFMKATYYRKK